MAKDWKPEYRNVVITLRVNTQENEAIRAAAKKAGLTMAEYVRELVLVGAPRRYRSDPRLVKGGAK